MSQRGGLADIDGVQGHICAAKFQVLFCEVS